MPWLLLVLSDLVATITAGALPFAVGIFSHGPKKTSHARSKVGDGIVIDFIHFIIIVFVFIFIVFFIIVVVLVVVFIIIITKIESGKVIVIIGTQ